MKISKRILNISILTIAFIGSSALPSEATSPSGQKVSTKQIILDTGGGGGEGATLPDVKWTFRLTPGGKPFIFWSWDPTS